MKVRTSLALAGSAAALATAGLLAGPALASSAAPAHTLHFNTHTITMHNFGKTGGVTLDKDTHAGKVVAYDMVDYVSANGVDVSLGLPDGFLYAHHHLQGKRGWHHGQGSPAGTATYKGATGSVKGQSGKSGATVTVTYRG